MNRFAHHASTDRAGVDAADFDLVELWYFVAPCILWAALMAAALLATPGAMEAPIDIAAPDPMSLSSTWGV